MNILNNDIKSDIFANFPTQNDFRMGGLGQKFFLLKSWYKLKFWKKCFKKTCYYRGNVYIYGYKVIRYGNVVRGGPANPHCGPTNPNPNKVAIQQ